MIRRAPLLELVGTELDEALADHAVADDDLCVFPVLAAARKRCAAGVRTELLRTFLRVAVNINVFAWLTLFSDAAPRDSLLFTWCSNSFLRCLQRLGARERMARCWRVEAIRCGQERRAAGDEHDP